jgi:hypothetical protein
MKWVLCLFIVCIFVTGSAFSQASRDSTFSVFVNNSMSFSRANDLHINKWLQKYGYPTEPHVLSSYNFELAAIPESSRIMYSIKVSTITSAKNLTSFNLVGGGYMAIAKNRQFMFLAGLAAGYHNDIINLNGKLPPDYLILANQYNTQLSLRRDGLFVEPAVRAFWFPVTLNKVQLGLFANLGYDMDFNSKWKLGYYDNNHGRANHFKKIKNPTDQQKVNEYGLSYSFGLSLHLRIL